MAASTNRHLKRYGLKICGKIYFLKISSATILYLFNKDKSNPKFKQKLNDIEIGLKFFFLYIIIYNSVSVLKVKIKKAKTIRKQE